MKLIWQYLRKYRVLCILDFFCAFGFLVTELGLPYLFSLMVDHAILPHNKQGVLHYGLMMGGVIVLGVALSLILAIVCSKITTAVITEIRDDLFEKVQNFTHEDYEQFGNSSLLTRMTNDPIQIFNFLNMILRMGITAPLMFIGSMMMIYMTSHSLAYVVISSLPLLLLGVFFIGKLSEPISKQQQQALDHLNKQMQENLFGIRVIRAFNRQEFEQKKFNEKNNNLSQRTKVLNLLMAVSNPAFNFLFLVVLALILWLGTHQIASHMIPIGSFVAITEYIFHALYSTMLFAMIFMMYPRANVSAKRILEVLSTSSRLKNGKEELSEPISYIKFDDVSLHYPGDAKATLSHISFEAKQGETIAFVGSIGSGKSSILKGLARLYDVSSGQVIINGKNIKNYTLDSIRRRMGYVSQKATLFNGSIESNLKNGNENATDEELWESLSIAQAESFILEKEHQLLEPVTENGNNFSGGQKQRLAIARAIIRKPDIYLFDDSFSALDFKTDAALRKALSPLLKNAITLIVAQRVSTVMNADQIIVLDHGTIVAKGTHTQLLKTSEVYREIVNSQFEKEEFENEAL